MNQLERLEATANELYRAITEGVPTENGYDSLSVSDLAKAANALAIIERSIHTIKKESGQLHAEKTVVAAPEIPSK